MKYSFVPGLTRTLRTAALALPLLLLPAMDGGAGTTQWSGTPGREKPVSIADASQAASGSPHGELPPPVIPAPVKAATSAVRQIMALPFFLDAHAAAPEMQSAAPQPLGSRGMMRSPQDIIGRVNPGGPENWPQGESLSTTLGSAGTAPVAGAAPEPTPDAKPDPVRDEQAPVVAPPAPASPASAPTALPAPAVAPSVTTSPALSPVPPPPSVPSSPAATQPASGTSPVPPAPTGNAASAPQTGGSVAPAPAVQPVIAPVPAPVVTPPAPAQASAPAGEASPEALPSAAGETGLVTTLRESAVPSPLANATAASGGNATRPVIYVDEAGKVVPKPPEPDKIMEEAERLMDSTQYQDAIAKLEELKPLNISREMREKALYLISDATEALYAGKPLEGFDPVVRTTSEALNANLRAPRVPDALFRLGMAHLRVGNFGEAEGYFKALQRRFPSDINVPAAFTNLGMSLLDKGLFAPAAENFRHVMQEYPESSVLRDASIGLVKALVNLGDLKQAQVIADFVDKRWPRYYLTEPSFLELLARLDMGLGRLEPALQQYWLYYNLDPLRKDNAAVLTTIGDIYLRTGRPAAGMDIFSEVLKRYPDSPSAAQALLRLAEGGIHDSPITITEMDAVFAHPGNPLPQVAYREMRQRWPDNPRTVLAQLKLAMWQLWDKQYTDAMGTAAEFIDAYPENANVEQARDVIMRGFMAELKNSLAEENYGRILILWNGFPLVRERYGNIDPDLRNALARGYLERGDDAKAMELLAEFLKTPKNPRYSDAAFALYFNRYLQKGDWNALLDLGELVKSWEMTPSMRGQLDYAMALAAENLGLADRALPLWKQLADNNDIPLYQKAYATYFLAKDAERRKDIKEAYAYNKETLNLFSRLEQERSDKADPERIKEAVGALMDITEVGNRIPEALDWVERYNDFVPENSPEYPGLRFREARLYRKLGDTTKAKALLESIAQKYPDSPFAKAAESELRTFSVSRDLRNFMPPAAP